MGPRQPGGFRRFVSHRATQLVAVGILGLVIGGGVVGGVMAATGHDTRPGMSRLRDGGSGGYHQFRGGQGFGGQAPNGQGFGSQGQNGQNTPNSQNGTTGFGTTGTDGTGDGI
ncbi:MAG TPA: hypothetical protein VGH57_14980 [Amycolatopsis sp.]